MPSTLLWKMIVLVNLCFTQGDVPPAYASGSISGVSENPIFKNMLLLSDPRPRTVKTIFFQAPKKIDVFLNIFLFISLSIDSEW